MRKIWKVHVRKQDSCWRVTVLQMSLASASLLATGLCVCVCVFVRVCTLHKLGSVSQSSSLPPPAAAAPLLLRQPVWPTFCHLPPIINFNALRLLSFPPFFHLSFLPPKLILWHSSYPSWLSSCPIVASHLLRLSCFSSQAWFADSMRWFSLKVCSTSSRHGISILAVWAFHWIPFLCCLGLLSKWTRVVFLLSSSSTPFSPASTFTLRKLFLSEPLEGYTQSCGLDIAVPVRATGENLGSGLIGPSHGEILVNLHCLKNIYTNFCQKQCWALTVQFLCAWKSYCKRGIDNSSLCPWVNAGAETRTLKGCWSEQLYVAQSTFYLNYVIYVVYLQIDIHLNIPFFKLWTSALD